MSTFLLFPWPVCLQRELPGWFLRRAAGTISECSTTGSCQTRCPWMHTRTAVSFILRSLLTPTSLHMPLHRYEVRQPEMQSSLRFRPYRCHLLFLTWILHWLPKTPAAYFSYFSAYIYCILYCTIPFNSLCNLHFCNPY